jgi:hypothetical protein
MIKRMIKQAKQLDEPSSLSRPRRREQSKVPRPLGDVAVIGQ